MNHVLKIFFMANLFSLQNILWKGCETGSWRRSENKCSTAVYDICKRRTNTLASGNGFSHKSLQNKVNGSSSNHNAGKGGYCTAHALHRYILHTLYTPTDSQHGTLTEGSKIQPRELSELIIQVLHLQISYLSSWHGSLYVP